MEALWQFTDYFMDFNKVRTFQEWCGLREAAGVSDSTQVTAKGTGPDTFDDHAQCKELYDDFRSDSSDSEVHCRANGKTFYSVEKDEKRMQPTAEECAKTYTITNRFLYHLFMFGSTLGHEVFYITFVPFVFWNVDPFIGRKMVVVWVVTMYIGQALKDLIQWPRPSWPPVFKLETRVEAEYGIPSTHAVAGTAIPFSFLMAMYGRYDFTLEFGIIVACSWCALVACSRLYVGMHTILDVMAGIALVAIYLCLGWPFMDMVEEYTMTSKFAPWIIILSHFLLGVFYPSTNHYTTSRGDTVIILAAGAGIHVGSWMVYQYGIEFGPSGDLPYSVCMPSLASLGISLARTFVGYIILFLVRAVMKSISLTLICFAVGVPKNNPISRRRKDVEISYKFVTYMMVGFFTMVIPKALEYMNLVH